ncbi:hypothetical protein PHAVU_001G070100 [Phaseolus vulgaris]|uniref:Wall-associated receptor kinase galacturonan-binding domain-containing protein n=1 Tax=Phaseolus vulgaris TaxID=3885 RepID=V7CWZ8_PHAVU|nr:hypothetical protein PHAVU_001G070100g [Phaseolus vulgaris]ESW33446.1 hypothetical protein PHAVU_001G070100g [Phaseolus vulgaris]
MWRERALIILVFLLHLIHGEDACPSSSCGKISNISYPFRLKGDAKGCGLTGYELSCKNNIALFSLYSGTFHVQAINYNNFTIRVVDPGLQQTNCSSLPRYFFSPSNFTNSYQLIPPFHRYYRPKDSSLYQTIHWVDWYYRTEPLVYEHIVFLNCSHRVIGKLKYVDTDGCLNWESKGYIYAIAGDLIAEDFEVGCHVKLVSPTSWRGLDTNTYFYDMMHTALLYGFEHSWIPLACEGRCVDYYNCYFSSSSQTLECYNEEPLKPSWGLYVLVF